MLRTGALVALALLACSASEADAAHPGRNGLIAYAEGSDDRGGTGAGPFIYTVRPDGTGVRQLTETFGSEFIDFEPSWSPDGRHIAFVRSTGNTVGPETIGTEIWVMNADGKRERRLTRNRLFDETPSWSPDGKRLLFARGRVRFGDRRHRPFSDLWVMNADGSGQRPLARTPAIELEPAWAPRGGRIAFLVAPPTLFYDQLAYTIGGQRALWTAAADGSHPRFTGIGAALAPSAPDWSPDGTRIALGTRRDVATIAAGGSDLHVLGPGDFPAWSPDGSALVASAPYNSAFAGIGIFTLGGAWKPLFPDRVTGTYETVDQLDADWQPRR
jgi:Tol biopolymer transport system component